LRDKLPALGSRNAKVLFAKETQKESSMRPSKQIQTGLATLAAAALVTGCCGPKGERRSALHSSPAATTQYSDTSGNYAGTTTAESDRTRVRESDNTATTRGAGEWALPLYSESLRVGKREVGNGNVRLRKVVRTENASQPVELRRETVVIDREAFDQARRAADAGQASDFGARFEEKEITIDLTREEPVVEVTPFVSGRIVAQKRQQTDTQNVQRQIRREEVEVIKNGNDQDIVVSERVRASVTAPGTSSDRINVREREDSDANRGSTNQSGTSGSTNSQ
jgi:uncharacterized protein (TIGR02271 family)